MSSNSVCSGKLQNVWFEEIVLSTQYLPATLDT